MGIGPVSYTHLDVYKRQVPIELFDVTGTLHHQQHGGLQRGETLGTFRALSPTANGVAVIADAGIDHLGI